ncbi:MAG: hypothetical protein ACRDOO_01185 [Actinomadura sp.]
MTTDHLEDTLRRTLGAAAGTAPEPRYDLIVQVERRHRRRRSTRAGLAAAVAVALLGAGGLSGVRLLSDDGSSEVASGPSLPTRPVADPVPVKDLWPRAVRTVPRTLPRGGRAYEPVTLVDDHRLLVTSMAGFEQADAVWLYDLKAERAERIATIPHRADAATFASGFAVGDDQVVWWDSVREGDGETGEIWAAPLTGGTPRLITTTRLKKVDFPLEHLTVADGKVVWSAPTGVFEAPLSGGRARPVSGTMGYAILDWPWIGTAGDPERHRVTYERIRNVRTGEERTAELTLLSSEERSRRNSVLDAEHTWVCGITWCLGDHGGRTFAERRDGRNGHGMFRGAFSMGSRTPPALDRFVLEVINERHGEPQGYPRGTYLYDLETGKVADLGIKPTDPHQAIGNASERLYVVEGAGGYTLIDLEKIE